MHTRVHRCDGIDRYKVVEMARVNRAISFVVAYYPNLKRAKEMLGLLKRIQKEEGVQILDAAVIRHDQKSGGLKMVGASAAGSKDTAGKMASRRRPLSRLFPPSILDLGGIGAASNRAREHFTDLGFDHNLLKEIGENLDPSGAAVVAVIEEKSMQELAGAIAGYDDMTRFAVDVGAPRHLLAAVDEQEKRA